jgi:hypothetical protein
VKRDNRGESTPCIARNRPRLRADLVWVYDGFCELSSRRAAGFSYQALALSEIVEWLNFSGIDHKPSRRLFMKMIIAMDQAWLEYYAEKHNKKK